MNSNFFLGLSSSMDECCVLRSYLNFSQLKAEKVISHDMFNASSTNWGGKDSVSRTLKIEKLRIIGTQYILPKPITFSGVDYDHGCAQEWDFTVSMIIQVERMSDEDAVVCECSGCGGQILSGDNVCRVNYQNNKLYFCEECYITFAARKIRRRIKQ